ncbi:repulsive guidance molecule A [Striga asiatica]|uniref:Repulsive guidance molecule A n=1 Tax=Striga asiatica TaxID=4170 RepID=A0A5A7PA56_STRAF|nr:repulsive guidance molecule A [Striga asiatica]
MKNIGPLLLLNLWHKHLEDTVLHLSLDITRLIYSATVPPSAIFFIFKFLLPFSSDGESVLLHRHLDVLLPQPRHVHAQMKPIGSLPSIPIPAGARRFHDLVHHVQDLVQAASCGKWTQYEQKQIQKLPEKGEKIRRSGRRSTSRSRSSPSYSRIAFVLKRRKAAGRAAADLERRLEATSLFRAREDAIDSFSL